MSTRAGTGRSRLWVVLGLVTVLTYNTWALWRQVNGHPAIINGYLSELSASDQPYSFFFRGGDLTTAVIVLALGLRAGRLWRDRRRAAQAGTATGPGRWLLVAWLSLLLFGASTFLDSFFAMDCSPTLSAACRVAEETGQLSGVHYAHTWTSVGAQTGIVASMVATYLALARRRATGRREVAVRRVVLVLAAVEVVALVLMMGLLVAGAPGLGYPQAVLVAVASFWFALVGAAVSGLWAPSGRPSGPSAAGAHDVSAAEGWEPDVDPVLRGRRR